MGFIQSAEGLQSDNETQYQGEPSAYLLRRPVLWVLVDKSIIQRPPTINQTGSASGN